jgi:hypothetical protein
MENLLILAGVGIFTGILAGFLGIGGGTVLVPILVTLGNSAVEAVATSSLAIVVTSISGSIQNWRMGHLDFQKVLALGLPAIVTARLGALLADRAPSYILLSAFGLLLLINIYLVGLRKRLKNRKNQQDEPDQAAINPTVARIVTGGLAGLLAGLFGIGGGVIMVPMQMLLLGEPIKNAVRTSLGVIVITAISATASHAIEGNVLFGKGLALGVGGLLGAQLSTRFLPNLPDQWISIAFRGLLLLLSFYVFWQAWNAYQNPATAAIRLYFTA